jgi:lipopolysaccharide transport system permease protein
MLPWLPFAEAVGRSANVILEHRTLVKKLRFPVETLPLNLTFAGLITEAFALAVFLAVLAALRGIPGTVVFLPLILVPQLLLTAGLCWFFAAAGVFVRDLAQILGFALTLWFFVTPICYDAAALPAGVRGPLEHNPIYVLVRCYRRVLLEGKPPEWLPLALVTAVALVAAWLGYAWFVRLRRSFADVL